MNRQGLLSTTGLALLVLIIGLTFHEWEDRVPLREQEPVTGPSLVVEGARAESFGEDGQLRYTLHAQRLTRFEQETRTEMDAPDVELIRQNERWLVRADSGLVQGPENDLVLRGNVRARRENGQPLRLETAELRYFPQQDLVKAPGRVTIHHTGGQTRAGRMQADVAAGILKLESQVESRYDVPPS